MNDYIWLGENLIAGTINNSKAEIPFTIKSCFYYILLFCEIYLSSYFN